MILHVMKNVQILTLDAKIVIVQQHYYSVMLMDVNRAIILIMLQINVQHALLIVLIVMIILLAINV